MCTIWAFDLGKGSIGEKKQRALFRAPLLAVRNRRVEVTHYPGSECSSQHGFPEGWF